MTDQGRLLSAIDRTRDRHGFLTLPEMLALEDSGNVVFDPFSTLIARGTVIGNDNVFHPHTRFDRRAGAALRIGSGNVFHSNTVIESGTNDLAIGDGNLFGDGVVCFKANAPGAAIAIGDSCRFGGIVNVFGKTTLGTGCQILGNINVYDCSLGAGQSYSHPMADERGAVLKGSGTAKGIDLPRGKVIDGWRLFRIEDAVPQSTFHP
jgi:hypothetical protein